MTRALRLTSILVISCGLAVTSVQVSAAAEANPSPVRKALNSARDAARYESRLNALTTLVDEGKLTTDQAQALAKARGKERIRGLVRSGLFTASQLKMAQSVLKDSAKPDTQAAIQEALSKLVEDGVISEQQAQDILARTESGKGDAQGARNPNESEEAAGVREPGMGQGDERPHGGRQERPGEGQERPDELERNEAEHYQTDHFEAEHAEAEHAESEHDETAKDSSREEPRESRR